MSMKVTTEMKVFNKLTNILVVALISNVTIIKAAFSDESDVCTSQACMEDAQYLHSSLNETADPCEDFYNFSCGGWRVNNPRTYGDQWSNMAILQWKSTVKLINLLENETLYSDSELVINKAQQFYKSCKNAKWHDQENIQTMKEILLKLGYPTIDETWDANSHNWLAAALDAALHFATDVFFDISLDIEEKNTPLIKIKPPKFEVDDKLLDKIELLNRYVSVDTLDSDLNELNRFVDDLSEIVNQGSKSESDEYVNKVEMTIEEMNRNNPYIDWITILREMFKSVNIEVNQTQKVTVYDKFYFEKLGDLIEQTDQRVIANYIAQRVITEFGSSAVFFFRVIDDQSVAMSDVAIYCSSETEKYFGLSLSYFFVRHYFNSETIDELQSFLTQLKTSFTNTLQTNEWMDDDTRMKAQFKLNEMISYIAIPTWLVTADILTDVYSKLGSIDTENYVAAFRALTTWIKRIEFRAIEDKFPDLVDVILGGASEVNAAYFVNHNKIRVKYGIISRPYYYDNSPLALNFGAIGYVLAHEMLHGFDPEGSKYDESGKLRMWWKNETREVYEQKVQCFIDQYSNFPNPVPGLNKPINGTQTVDENIADNGGIYQAFTAYKVYAALNAPEKDLKLPLEMSKYTKDQLFFIAFANTFCENNSIEENKDTLVNDPHSPNLARVTITLSNSELFSKAFNCPLGSRMNPVHKCILW